MSNRYRGNDRVERRRRARAEAEDKEIYVVSNRSNRRRSTNQTRPANSLRSAKPSPRFGGFIVLFIFVLFFFYIAGYILNMLNKPTIPTTEVQIGSIDSPELVDGLIVRQEKVYQSGAEGDLIFAAGNYDRIKKGMSVCSIQNGAEVMEIEQRLSTIDNNIMKMQSSRESYSLFAEDVKKADANIKNILESNMSRFMGNDVSELYVMKTNLDKHMGVRNQMLLNEERGSVATLVNDRKTYESRLDSSVDTIQAEASGILSYSTDGYEDVFLIDSLPTLTKEQISAKKDAAENGEETEKDLFKIVESNDWYVATYIKNELIPTWTEGMSTEIYLTKPEDEIFNEQEVYIETLVTGELESYAVLKSTKNLLDYIDSRNVKFKITEGLQEGLKIPNTAVVSKNLLKIPSDFVIESTGGKEVQRVAGEQIVSVPVIVKQNSEDETSVYILQDFSNINIGDVIVADAGARQFEITELETSKGIYLLNSGIAEFKAIVVDEDTPSNSAYTILDPEKNGSINQHDKIVSDAANISEGQKIF